MTEAEYKQFEANLRAGERFHHLQVPPEVWAVIRVDGRGFSRLTETNYQKPFDRRFFDAMSHVAQALLLDFSGLAVYFQSDEASLLLPLAFSNFGREWEKLVSLTAGLASAQFAHATGFVAPFDARIWLGESIGDVVSYFRWRQSDGTRCALNGWCYWTLHGEGHNRNEVTHQLDGMDNAAKQQLLRARGIDWATVPLWQKRGALVCWEEFEKVGFDPRQGEVTAIRRRITVDENLPAGKTWEAMITALCRSSLISCEQKNSQ